MENQKDIDETTSKGGAPEGNNNAGKGSQLSALLRAALNANDRLKMRQGVEAVADAFAEGERWAVEFVFCLLYTSPSPRDRQKSRMPSSA